MNKLFTKVKHSISELSQLYHHIKGTSNPTVKWMDVMRKTSRVDVLKTAHTHNIKQQMKSLKKAVKNADVDDKPLLRLNKKTDIVPKPSDKKLKNRGGSSVLKQLLKTMRDSKLKPHTFYIVTLRFYGTTEAKHFTLTTTNKERMIERIVNLTLDTTFIDGHAFSDVTEYIKQGHKIKEFSLVEKSEFEKGQVNLFKDDKNKRSRINHKSQGFFPILSCYRK